MNRAEKIPVHWTQLISSSLRVYKEYKEYFACGVTQRHGHHVTLQMSSTLWDLLNNFFTHFTDGSGSSKKISVRVPNSLVLDCFQLYQKSSQEVAIFYWLLSWIANCSHYMTFTVLVVSSSRIIMAFSTSLCSGPEGTVNSLIPANNMLWNYPYTNAQPCKQMRSKQVVKRRSGGVWL